MKQLLSALLVIVSLAACVPSETPVVAVPSASESGATTAAAAQTAPAALPPVPALQVQAAQKVASSDPQVSDIVCPQMELRGGTETLRSFETGSAGTAPDLKYQANITAMTRECSILGLEVGIKTVVTGRVILGPKGKPGTFKLPVRIAIVKGAKEPLWSKLIPTQVKIAAGQASASFTVNVEDILFPREPTDNLGDVKIFVGFDPEKSNTKKPVS